MKRKGDAQDLSIGKKKPRRQGTLDQWISRVRWQGSSEPLGYKHIVERILPFVGALCATSLRLVNRLWRDALDDVFSNRSMKLPTVSNGSLGKIPPSLLWRWWDSPRLLSDEEPIAWPLKGLEDLIADSSKNSNTLVDQEELCAFHLRYEYLMGATDRIFTMVFPLPPLMDPGVGEDTCIVCMTNRFDRRDECVEVCNEDLLKRCAVFSPCISSGIDAEWTAEVCLRCNLRGNFECMCFGPKRSDPIRQCAGDRYTQCDICVCSFCARTCPRCDLSLLCEYCETCYGCELHTTFRNEN